jgi:glutathione S-transferase
MAGKRPAERFSAAGVTALVTVDFATNAMKLPVEDALGAVRRWYEDVFSRASAKT